VDLNCWDSGKLEENFVYPDVVAISSIPIGTFTEDFWAWSLERNGNFPVRSCYKQLSIENQNNDLSSSGSGSNPYWKVLWKLEVPPKIRCFWWRVLNEYVPCRQILKRRYMDEIAFCKTCGAEEESIFHAFFECTWAHFLNACGLDYFGKNRRKQLHLSYLFYIRAHGQWAYWMVI
jgi:hypothetical protein